MQESGQPFENPMNRPAARPSSAPTPIQRGNYGIPARQMAPQPMTRPAVASTPVAAVPAPVQTPTPPQPAQPVYAAPSRPSAMPQNTGGPQFMDIAGPRPVSTPPAAPVAAVQPALPAQPATDQRPLFTPTQTAVPEKETKHKRPKIVSVAVMGLLAIGVLLVIAGGVRFVSAGSTANDTIAVGAVSANDGRSMTIQFTATDGKLHKIAAPSNRELIPGSAVEVAYKSGAPEATARQVSVVKGSRNLGIMIILGGVLCFAVAGIVATISKLKSRSNHHGRPLTTTVTA